MLNVPTAALLWLLCARTGQGPDALDAASTDKAIGSVLDHFVVAWNSENPKMVAAVWSPNGRLVSARGSAIVGRARIERAFARGMRDLRSKPVSTVPYEPIPGYHTRLMTGGVFPRLDHKVVRIRMTNAHGAVATGTWNVLVSPGPEGLMFGTDRGREGGYEARLVKTSSGWLLSELRFTPRSLPPPLPPK